MTAAKKYKTLPDALTILRNIPCEQRDAELAQQEAQRQETANYERFTHCGVPPRYWRESFDTFVTADANGAILQPKRALLDMMQNDFMTDVRAGGAPFIALLGNCGTGKTHLAASALREVSGCFRLSSAIVAELRQAHSYSSHTSESAVLREYALPRLLVIDEVGRSDNAAEEKYMLYQILNARYNVEKPLIITANMTKKEFVEYIGTAAVDRFTECGRIHELNWASYRLTLRRNREGK